MKIKLISCTVDPEQTIAHAAKTCYSSESIFDIDFTNQTDVYLEKLKNLGHMSPFEHATFVYAIDGISRACSHQLVRHRLASYSQRSQRYINESGFDVVYPESIMEDDLVLAKYDHTLEAIDEFYDFAIAKGIPAEDARYILPNATCTQLVMSMNARSWIHFCTLRLCNRAQWEIRELATLIAEDLTTKFPSIFKNQLLPNCLKGKCTEGEYTCKKPICKRIQKLAV